MASKVQKAQRLTVALTEGFLNMIWEQTYSVKSNNKTIFKMTEDVRNCCRDIKDFLDNEGGWITVKEAEQIRKAVDYIKVNHFKEENGKRIFTNMMAVAIMTDMVVYQLKYSKGKKRELFNKLLFKINYFVRYFDKNRTWQDDNDSCLKATEKLRELMGVQ